MRLLKSVLNNFWVESTLNSYSIILFSHTKILALLLLFVTFMSPKIGFCGLAFVLCFHFLLVRLGYDKTQIRSGLLGFNSLLIGLSIAYSYEMNAYFAVLFILSVLLAIVIIVWCKNHFGKYNLPFLTVPFFLIVNIISLSTKNFDVFHVNMDEVFHENTLAALRYSNWYQMAHCLDGLAIPNHLKVFLVTFSTVFYQKSVLGGILIVIGLFLYSRIAFLYSIIGFYAALFFYHTMGGDLQNLTYFYSGVNFIFMAIALGSFFYIANAYTMALVFVLTPVMMFFMIAMEKILVVFQMNALSMPFSILTTMILYIFMERHTHKLIIAANTTYFSPEKSLYEHLHLRQRKVANPFYSMFLPFWGEWQVSQGYNGKITHLGDWSKALDFVIVNEEAQTFGGSATKPSNFYCYNKPVLAPADGYIYEIVNHVEDNEINDVNVLENWGNSVVINHNNGLYSQLSHLKKDSFLVSIGDYVKKGTVVAACGNSGRSPEPHIHFQVQHTYVIGAKTVDLPLTYFIENKTDVLSLRINEVPKENALISNVETMPLLLKAFDFKPNNRLKITDNKEQISIFEIYTTEWNELYFYCPKTNSKLYFKNDGILFSFVRYEGTANAPLFEFYKACHAILLGYYPTVTIDDFMPNYWFMPFGLRAIHDLLAPLKNFITIRFCSQPTSIDNMIQPNLLKIRSKYYAEIFGKRFFRTEYDIAILGDANMTIENIKTGNKFKITCEQY